MNDELEKKKTLWEEDIEKALNNTKKSDMELLMNILNIVVFNRFGQHIGKMYKIIDDKDKFSQLLDEFSNKEFRFPNSEEFKKALTLALVFYYRNVLHYSWEETQKQFPYEKDIPLRYGKKLSYLDKDIKVQLEKLLNYQNKEQDALEEFK